jgi:outer membrane murein-binding lipoprotein Lpp
VTVVGEGAADNAGNSTVPTYITGVDSNGNLIQVGGKTGAGWSAGALNVFLVNDGITFTVSASATFSSQISVNNAGVTALYVQGSTTASHGVWVTGSTNGDPIVVQGSGAGGALTVDVNNFSTQTNTINSSIGQVKNNTDFMAAVKKALYSDAQSVGAFDFADKNSIYTLVRDNIGANIAALKDAIVPNGSVYSSQDSMAVTVVGVKQQPSFMARTAAAVNASQNLTAFNGGAGYTCANGVRIKTSRIATGANASQNEIMCVISEADAALYGASAGTASYVLYHGDEMFFEVDNINKIKVFYPAYSAAFAPHNTGTGMTFSFYAS